MLKDFKNKILFVLKVKQNIQGNISLRTHIAKTLICFHCLIYTYSDYLVRQGHMCISGAGNADYFDLGCEYLSRHTDTYVKIH